MDSQVSPALMVCLQAAVPLWQERLRRWSWADVEARARTCAEEIGSTGDVLQFGSKKRGAAAAAFNRLAEGLACASFAPGGVCFLGLHFEDRHASAAAGKSDPGAATRPQPWPENSSAQNATDAVSGAGA